MLYTCIGTYAFNKSIPKIVCFKKAYNISCDTELKLDYMIYWINHI